jgi:hypothetical protein
MRALSQSPTTAEAPACFIRRPAQSERDPQRVSAGRLIFYYSVLQQNQCVVGHVRVCVLQAHYRATSSAQKAYPFAPHPRPSL